MIRIEQLEKRYDRHLAVGGVDLAVPAGSFLVLVGPSGCGKSTMLRMLAGLETPTAGRILFGDQLVSEGERGWTIEPGKRDTGLVFQSYALWPHMSVAGNVDWPLKVAGMTKADRTARVREVLALLGIERLAERFPNEISGGQQQRVAIARMIAPKPGILLFDEPLSNLDAKLRVEMRTELLRIHRATGATSVYVTHDQVEAMTMATHVAVMNEGLVEQFGSPADLVANPQTAFVATFVGTPPSNLVPAERLPHAMRSAVAEGTRLMYRPEDLRVATGPGADTLELVFAEASPVAGRVMVTGLDGPLRLTAVVEGVPALKVGEPIHFVLPPHPSAVFAGDGSRLA